MLFLYNVELSKVQDVRPCLACTDAVQLESQHMTHLVCTQSELLSNLASCRSINHYLFHFFCRNTLSKALLNAEASKQ